MDLPANSPELRRERTAIEAELDALRRRDSELRSALNDVDHDMRRCNDALERHGWSSRENEARQDLLLESRDLIVRDRRKIRERCAVLEKRLTGIRRRLHEETCDD